MILSLEILFIAIGVFFMFVASLGVLRLPDFYSRVHAPTKAATLGLLFLLVAVILAVPEGVVTSKALLALLFIGATAPVGAHILSRAAYRSGVPPAETTSPDEYKDAVERRRAAAAAGEEPAPAPDVDEDAHDRTT